MQRLFLADVFAAQAHAGNPLAVVIGDQPLPDTTMQRVAAEINYSETTRCGGRPWCCSVRAVSTAAATSGSAVR